MEVEVVSISLNFVSGRSGGAPASPVQQQETEMSAIVARQKEEMIRIMESKNKGLVNACGVVPVLPWIMAGAAKHRAW